MELLLTWYSLTTGETGAGEEERLLEKESEKSAEEMSLGSLLDLFPPDEYGRRLPRGGGEGEEVTEGDSEYERDRWRLL